MGNTIAAWAGSAAVVLRIFEVAGQAARWWRARNCPAPAAARTQQGPFAAAPDGCGSHAVTAVQATIGRGAVTLTAVRAEEGR